MTFDRLMGLRQPMDVSYGGYGGGGYGGGYYGPPMGRMPWEDPYAPQPPYAAPPVPAPQQARRSTSLGGMVGAAALRGISGQVGQIGARGGQAQGLAGTVGDAVKGAAMEGRGGLGGFWDSLRPADKVGSVLGVLGTGADIYGAHQDRKRADEQERYIREQERKERERLARSGQAIAPMLQEYLARR